MRFHDPVAAASHVQLRASLVASMRERYAWEEVSCPLCGPAPSGVASRKDGIEVRSCDRCGHLFVSPRLPEEAVAELYGSAYWDAYCKAIGSPTLQERVEFDYLGGFYKLDRDVLPFRRAGRLLDIGASNGGMVRAARERGFVAEGIEPSQATCDIAREAHGVVLRCGDVRTIGLPDACFDIVTLHDVLEHVFDPVGVLQTCKRILSPAGLLVIETPTTDSILHRLEDDDWEVMSPLEHVHLFNEGNLCRLVTAAGFRLLDCYCPHENNVIVIGEASA